MDKKVRCEFKDDDEKEKEYTPHHTKEILAQFIQRVLRQYHNCMKKIMSDQKVAGAFSERQAEESHLEISHVVQVLFFLRAITSSPLLQNVTHIHLDLSTLYWGTKGSYKRVDLQWRSHGYLLMVNHTWPFTHIVGDYDINEEFKNAIDLTWDCPPWLHRTHAVLTRVDRSYSFAFSVLKYLPRNIPEPNFIQPEITVHTGVRTSKRVFLWWGDLCLGISKGKAVLWKKNPKAGFFEDQEPDLTLMFTQPDALQMFISIGTNIRDHTVPPANDRNLRLFYTHHLPAVQSFLYCLETLRRRSGDNQCCLPTELVLHVLSFLSPRYDLFAM